MGNPPWFEPAFQRCDGLPVPPYLVLLHASSLAESRTAVEVIAAAAAAAPDPLGAIQGLLRDDNWRSHLVAAVALLVRGGPTEGLWARMARGSWVTPQLAATVALLDADFDTRAMACLTDTVPVDGKCWAALLTLLDAYPAHAPWIAARMADPVVARAMAAHPDAPTAVAVAPAWRDTLRLVLAGRAVPRG